LSSIAAIALLFAIVFSCCVTVLAGKPKDEGALNIESLAADGDKLWIGFRSPINKAKEALLVPLLNPTEAIKEGARAKLGDPVALKLGGLGVRDMVAWNDGFLIIAGDFNDRFAPGAKPSRVFS
jgi:Protein of unknown function (DUF3616)